MHTDWPADCAPAENHRGEVWRLRLTLKTESDLTRAVVGADTAGLDDDWDE